jgi:hypothetical protein
MGRLDEGNNFRVEGVAIRGRLGGLLVWRRWGRNLDENGVVFSVDESLWDEHMGEWLGMGRRKFWSLRLREGE